MSKQKSQKEDDPFVIYSKKQDIPVNKLRILYEDQKSICLSQNHYMRKFVSRKNTLSSSMIVNNITLHYTSWFQNYGFAEEILSLSNKNDFYQEELTRLFKTDNKHVQLILDNYHCIYLKNSDRIIGYILFTTSPKEVLIQFLFISPEYRKRGFGLFLLNYVEIVVYYLRSLGFVKNKKGIICAYTTNVSMCSLLEKMNYERRVHHIERLMDHDYYCKSFR